MVQVSKNFFSRSVVLGDTYVGNLGQNGPPAVLFRKTDLISLWKGRIPGNGVFVVFWRWKAIQVILIYGHY